MDREGFRNRMKQYKKAWEENPGLKYWEWKQKYDSAPKPDNMPSQPKPDAPMDGSQQAENRAHRWDNEHYVDQVNTVFDADRHRSWKEPAQKTFGNRVKFTYRDFMKPADVKHMNFLKSIGRLGSALKGASIFGEAVQNLFPSEEAELIEDMRAKMDKQNKWLTGQEDIPKYDEGGEVTVPTEEEFLKTKKKNLNDYELKNFDPWIRFFGERDHILDQIRKKTNEDAFTQKRRYAIAEKYTAPFIKDKEIVLTNSGNLTGAKLSENLLDSLYKYSDVVGIPVQDAIGLAAQETTFGKFYGLMDPKDKISVLAATGNPEHGFDPIESLHNHSYEADAYYDPANEVRRWLSRKYPNVKEDVLTGLAADELENNPNYYINEGVKRYNAIENPWVHAFNRYKSGKYNSNDKRHTVDVQNAGKLVMQDPAIKKWAQEKGIAFAEGTDGVTGPPTYEQWYADMNQYNPTILDNASLYWSMEAAKKDLHNAAMKLPGYAERWAEYYRSLPKTDPDINEFVDELWENENPNNVGLKNGKYYPHKSPEGGAATIGPGFKLGSGSHKITKKQAERGMTKSRLDQEARRIGKQHLNAVDQFINYGQTTNPADTVSPQIKMGLMDLRHQVGPLNEWSSLREAVLNGDIEGIRKESTVTWNDNGKTKVDKRRKKIRDEKYFYYE